MRARFYKAALQLEYLFYELRLIVNKKWWCWLICWFSPSPYIIISYRLDRFFYLLTGEAWTILRILLIPILFLLYFLGAKHDIHYRADIGRGLKVLHPILGVVVSAYTVAGVHLTLTGGNCIGSKGQDSGTICLGNHVILGANAVVLGPIRIGDEVTIGAGAVVIHDAVDRSILVGVPARPIKDARFSDS